MAQPGALDNAGIRSLYDEQQSYYPADTNIAKGLVVVFDTTSGDDRSVVLPNHANAQLGGRAFAGISAEEGSPSSAQDKAWSVQVRGTADCLLKASTSCTRGDVAAYDPADGGRIVPYTSKNQQPIGRFMQTKTGGANVFVGVKLIDASAPGAGLLGGIVADAAAAATNVTTEQTHTNATQTIKANRLAAGTIVDIEGLLAITNQNGTNQVTLKLYFGATAILTTVAFDPATGDLIKFKARVKIRTAGASGTFVAMAESNRGADAAVAGAAPVLDGTASTTVDTTADTTVSVSTTWDNASANNVSVVRMLDVILL